MKKITSIAVVIILLVLVGCSKESKENVKSDPVIIIFDTDFGGDADDLGALVMLHNFMARGECELLAVMCWQTEISSVSGIDAVNRFYNNPVPVGTRKDETHGKRRRRSVDATSEGRQV